MISPQDQAIAIFGLLIFSAFMVLAFRGDTGEKTYQKLIGGVSVLLVAVLVDHPVTTVVALFIGGLIIATEDFMKSLAAILRADSKSIPDTLNALNAVAIRPATEGEVRESEKEKEEIVTEISAQQPRVALDRIPYDRQRDLRKRVLTVISEKYGNCFSPELKLENEYGSIVVDGVVHHSKDKSNLDLEHSLGLLDIEIISIKLTQYSEYLFEMRVRRVLERIRYLFVNKPVLIVFAARGLTKEFTEKLAAKLKDTYGKEGVSLSFGFFNITDDTEIELLSLPPLNDSVDR